MNIHKAFYCVAIAFGFFRITYCNKCNMDKIYFGHRKEMQAKLLQHDA